MQAFMSTFNCLEMYTGLYGYCSKSFSHNQTTGFRELWWATEKNTDSMLFFSFIQSLMISNFDSDLQAWKKKLEQGIFIDILFPVYQM